MSVFSQSFILSEENLKNIDIQCENVQEKRGSTEDPDIVEESPTGKIQQTSIRVRNTSTRSVKISKVIKPAKIRVTEKDKENTLLNDDCSEFFDIKIDELPPPPAPAASTAVKDDEDLSKYFDSEFDFSEKLDSSRAIRADTPKINVSELERMFQDSDIDFKDDEPKNTDDLFQQSDDDEDDNVFERAIVDENINLESEPIDAGQFVAPDRWETSSLFDESLRMTEDEADTPKIEVDRPPDDDNVTFTQSNVDLVDIELHKQEIKEAFMAENDSFMKSINLDGSLNISNVSDRQTRIKSLPVVRQPELPPPLPVETECGSEPPSKSCDLASWGLPNKILIEYEKKGIRKMFDWQTECLGNRKILFDLKNLVYSAPTSAGKTLVSEILMIKGVVERRKKAVIILPFISVVREKMFYLQELLRPANFHVEGFFGGYTPPGGFDRINVAVCTIEKANSIINRVLEQDKLSDIGTIVLDEIHLISDASRGYILELLLAKILFACRKHKLKIQIITMSATLPNLDLLARWLDAEFYETKFRPVDLIEMVNIGNVIYDDKGAQLRQIDPKFFESLEIADPDHVAQLTLETLLESHQVIIFCPSKDWCERLCLTLAETIYKFGRSQTEKGRLMRERMDLTAIEELKGQFRNTPVGLDSTLEKTVSYGCAYHHAGLTTDERDIIESSFKSGVLKVIVATSTLSSGVNLPARRVIIRTPLFGRQTMSSLTYKQMIGRAGRTGKDTLGESILICSDSNVRNGKELVCAKLTPISSCLDVNEEHLKRAILEIVASGVAKTTRDLQDFVQCTLLWVDKQEYFKSGGQAAPDPISKCIDFLIEYEFIRLQVDETTNDLFYIPTMLGNACLSSSIPPKDGILLFSELQKSRRSFVLETELHAVYLVTPYSVCYQIQDIDWLLYLDLWEKSSNAMKRVGEFVGIKESFLVKAMRGLPKLDLTLLQIHKRFYVSLALYELINEMSIRQVSSKYKVTRGLLQSLQQTASTFAGLVNSFCASLGWSMLAVIISQFKNRLFFGISQELIDLMRIPSLTSLQARSLHSTGVTGLIDLANSKVLAVENVLLNSIGFESEKKRDDENEYDVNQRNRMRNFYVTGKPGLSVRDAAKLLIDEARSFLQSEMGLDRVIWSQTEVKDDDASPKRKPSMDINDEASPPKSARLHEEIPQAPSIRPTVKVIVVDLNENIFNNFVRDLNESSEIAFSIAVDRCESSAPKIGENLLIKNAHRTYEAHNLRFRINDDTFVSGIAFYFHSDVVYFIDLQNDSIGVSLTRKLEVVLSLLGSSDKCLMACDIKEQLIVICELILKSREISCRIIDPNIAHWLLNCDGVNINARKMIQEHIPEKSGELQFVCLDDRKLKYLNFGMNHGSEIPGKIRASEECFIVHHIIKAQSEKLKTFGRICLFKHLMEIEMPIQLSLLKLEVAGLPVNPDNAERLHKKLSDALKQLETEIYKIHGAKFNINSSTQVARALGVKVKPNEKVSMPKETLEQFNTPLSNLIQLYRKIGSTLTNSLHPIMVNVKDGRIHGKNISFTTSGRISMQEPNLQNVARDFEFKSEIISCRGVFEATEGRVLLAADFCQLELRILTHLSGDTNLVTVMTSDSDVFRMIAAKWNCVDEADVTEEMRHNTKQICYAIIYGMGNRSLAHTLKKDENEVLRIVEQFHNKYPGLRTYTETIIKATRENGFIETMSGRRRQLPNILSEDSSVRSQAERQAVNTTIQGSAADIAKMAILRMERNLKKYQQKLGINRADDEKSFVHFVLHLHDELIYEVPETSARQLARILKSSMENCVKLSIPLRVKVKIGKSWGSLEEIIL